MGMQMTRRDARPGALDEIERSRVAELVTHLFRRADDLMLESGQLIASGDMRSARDDATLAERLDTHGLSLARALAEGEVRA